MLSARPLVLTVDDNEINLRVIGRILERGGYDMICAKDGVEALAALETHPEVSVILLDRIMPRMDGIEFMRNLDQRGRMDIPVVMQTASGSASEITEGIQAGVFYYLVKPFDENVLLTITKSALQSRAAHRRLAENLDEHIHALAFMSRASFEIRTIEEARILAAVIAKRCPNPAGQQIGLTELMLNAVEHGNLALSYHDKTRLLESGEWDAEIERRLRDPVYGARTVKVDACFGDDTVRISIRDEGDGFDPGPYLELTPDRAFDLHGRGIAAAHRIAFDTIEYQGTGNQVVATVKVDATSKADAA